jgi:hypothetical protein
MRTIPEIHIVLLRSRLSEDKVADNKCHEVCRHLEGILKKIIYNITSKHCSNILVLVAYCLNGKLGNKDNIENMLKGFVTEKFLAVNCENYLINVPNVIGSRDFHSFLLYREISTICIEILPLESICIYQLMFTHGGHQSACSASPNHQWCKIILGALVFSPYCFLISSSLSLLYLSISLPTLACQRRIQNFSTRDVHVQAMLA